MAGRLSEEMADPWDVEAAREEWVKRVKAMEKAIEEARHLIFEGDDHWHITRNRAVKAINEVLDGDGNWH